MDQDSQASLGVLVVFAFVVIFLVLLLEGGSPKKATKDPGKKIRRIGQETRQVMDNARDGFVTRELMFLSAEKGRQVLEEMQPSPASATFPCPNPTCDSNGQKQSGSSPQTIIRYGSTSAGSQRYRCNTCGRTFTRS